ncbi:class I SAM-dependent methyltransferase [Methylorubrum populi]|jgi:release factor glutamine methyltransferase|uniref:Methyltransferase n=1 Tax=Methylorubrum rhodesianum TaxID=29427 RepID=A0ABU9ZCN7_9HYPH|nr:methyltransferase [Methylorubrum rhodesianum]MBK3406725.1 class I SAM-dependent methyltransferase [Methylorubrum rhodesianum]MBY0140871.1 class I SAM-dependent methyltransferase [Methylorubrum populi]
MTMADVLTRPARQPETGTRDEKTDEALLALARAVRDSGYRFTTVTPTTHARVNARPGNGLARSLRDVLGWSRPFREGLIPAELTDLMRRADVLDRMEGPEGGLLKARIRLSSLDDELFLHAAYPPLAADSVFFGPDTMRFAEAVLTHLEERARTGQPSPRRVADIGCGSGAAGILVAKRVPEAEVNLVDINPAALRAAEINARLAGVENVRPVHSDMLSGLEGSFDLIVSNPPFMVDAGGRAYRHGGGPLGAGLSLRVVEAAAERLAPGGSLVLFTGSAIVEGEDGFRTEASGICADAGLDWSYREFDPDEYGEELDDPGYAAAERIALVILTATRRAEAR